MDSHKETTTTLGIVKGGQKTTKNLYILLDTGCRNSLIINYYLNLCQSLKDLNSDTQRPYEYMKQIPQRIMIQLYSNYQNTSIPKIFSGIWM